MPLLGQKGNVCRQVSLPRDSVFSSTVGTLGAANTVYIWWPASCVLFRITNMCFLASSEDFGWLNRIFMVIPFVRKLRIGCGKVVIARQDPLISAVGTTVSSDPAGYRCVPDMTGGTLPPHLFIGVREDVPLGERPF